MEREKDLFLPPFDREREWDAFLLDPTVTLNCFAYFPLAGVAELVDALDSGSSVRKDVRVRVSPSAPFPSSTTVPYTLAASN